MSDFSFVSSGNPEEDDAQMQRFLLHTARMEANICPNGCGPMTFLDPHNRECPACRFAGFSTVPFDMKGGTA